MNEELCKKLAEKIDGDVVTDQQERTLRARDTSLFYVLPEVIVFPRHEKDVVTTVSYVQKLQSQGVNVSITARAAGTCMTGGPLSTSLVLDCTRYLTKISKVSSDSASAEPGVYYRDFEKETLAHGWLMPSYPASRELAAIGGIVSNNSGGEKTLRYGKTEKYVTSLNVVLANGEATTLRSYTKDELANHVNEGSESARIHRSMYKLITEHYDEIMAAKPTVTKNSSGYYLWNVYDKKTETFDLSKLVIGSQGTLALITEATLTGVVPKQHRRMVITFLSNTQDLGVIIPRVKAFEPETLESYDDHTFKIAIQFLGDIARRMGGSLFTLGIQFLPELWMAITGGIPKIILMTEFAEDTEQEATRKATELYSTMKDLGYTSKMTHSEDESKKYWTFRRESFNLLRSKLRGYRTAPTIDDIVVHTDDLPQFMPRLESILSKYDLIYTVAGHMGDGNFHIIPLIDVHKKNVFTDLHNLMEEVYALVIEYKGSISAEHNDGLLRTQYLSKMYSPNIIKLFEDTKDIFDPQHILNPGKKVYPDPLFVWNHVDSA